MKPCRTAATGTQKVVLPSSVLQPDVATAPNLSMPAMSLTLVSWPFLKSSSEASKGRQVMMSPAVPASSLEFRAALYSFGAVGWKLSLMPGCPFSKTGMIFSCQIGRSSLRQLSMVSTVSAARAGTAAAKIAAPDRTQAVVLVIVFIFIFIFIFIFLLLSCSRQPLAGNPPSSSHHRYHQTMGPRASAQRMSPALDA